MSESVFNEEAIEYIAYFKRKFKLKFNIPVNVIYGDDALLPPIDLENGIYNDIIPRVSLDKLENIVNKLLINDPNTVHAKNIRSRTREKSVVTYRQCMFKIAFNMLYTYQFIGKHFGFDHSTVVYAKKHVDTLLEVDDKLICMTLSRIIEELKKEPEYVRSISSDSASETDS